MTTITYKQSPARRPTIDDLHGGLIEDDSEFPPDPSDPHADAMNQSDALLVAAHGLLEHTKLYVTFSGGTPSIAAIRSLRDDLLAGNFTIVDNGTGDTSITHTGGKLPSDSFPAETYPTGNAGDTTSNAESIATGWRIRTRTAGAAADVPFVLKIFGL